MQKTALFFVCWILTCPLISQNWEQVGNLNWVGPKIMYVDSVTGLMFAHAQSLTNGTDTINGIFTFDGIHIVSLAKDRSDCGNVTCAPALFLTRYEGDIYFSGSGLDWIDSTYVNGVGRWDGVQWSEALVGLVGNSFGKAPYLDGHFIRDGKLYASGYFRTADGDTCNSVAYWDGEHWTGLNFPADDVSLGPPRVNHVFFYKEELYAAGNFILPVDGEQVRDILKYDGVSWHAVGGSLKGGAADIWDWAIYKDELYICGYFRKIDGNAGNKIMRWDGQEWKEVGGGFCFPNITAQKMLVHEDKLYVVGIFDCVDNGLPVSNIAVWDGERWCSFGNSVFNNRISCIAAYKGEIYVGGGFTEVDGQPLKNFARWVGDHATDTCSAPITTALEPTTQGFSLSPNPATDLLQIQAPAPIESVWVFDALGREVYRESGSGERVSAPVGDFVPGLYFVVVRAGGESWGGKFVKM